LSRIRARGADRSFAAFLSRSRIPATTVALARHFVEGYYAADTERISAHSVAAGATDMDEPQRQYRLGDGYSGIVEWLRTGLDPERATLRTGCVVEVVRW